MKRILVVPDVHGRTFWKEAEQNINEVDQVIFLGDYVDPYPYESDVNCDEDALIDNFKNIIQFAKSHADKVVLLIGNHDAHYIDDNPDIRSSRYSGSMKNTFAKLIKDNAGLFNKAHYVGNILFSHAGVTSGWLDYNGFTANPTAESVYKFIQDSTYAELCQVGGSRGGMFPYGGPMWADIREHYRSDIPFEQIVGHTQGTKMIEINNVRCVDTHDVYLFEIED